MNISNLTLEDRERIAYYSGDVKTAAILGEMMDYQDEVDEETAQNIRAEGYDEGHDDGYEVGYEEGYAQGMEDA